MTSARKDTERLLSEGRFKGSRRARLRWRAFYRWFNHPSNPCYVYRDIAYFQEGCKPEEGNAMMQQFAHSLKAQDSWKS